MMPRGPIMNTQTANAILMQQQQQRRAQRGGSGLCVPSVRLKSLPLATVWRNTTLNTGGVGEVRGSPSILKL